MRIGILAPVPAVLPKSALDTCAAMGKVAFGTNAWELFATIDAEYGDGLPMLIYPFHHRGDPDKLCDPGFASFRGAYVGSVRPRRIKHPNPAVRPAVTVEGEEPDTGWAIFWEVGSLATAEIRGDCRSFPHG